LIYRQGAATVWKRFSSVSFLQTKRKRSPKGYTKFRKSED